MNECCSTEIVLALYNDRTCSIYVLTEGKYSFSASTAQNALFLVIV